MVAAKKQPAIRDMVNLSIPYEVRISPDGKNIAYLVRQTDWNDNAYQRHCIVYNRETKNTRQLSRRGSVSQIEWVDNTSLAVLKRENKSSQIFLFQDLTGEPMQITKHKGGVHRFFPFGEGFLYKANDPEKRENEDRKKQFGAFQYFEQEESASALYYVSLPRLKEYLAAMRLAGEDEEDNPQRPEVMLSKLMETPYSITSFAVAPNDKTI